MFPHNKEWIQFGSVSDLPPPVVFSSVSSSTSRLAHAGLVWNQSVMELMNSATNRLTAFRTVVTVTMTVNLIQRPPSKTNKKKTCTKMNFCFCFRNMSTQNVKKNKKARLTGLRLASGVEESDVFNQPLKPSEIRSVQSQWKPRLCERNAIEIPQRLLGNKAHVELSPQCQVRRGAEGSSHQRAARPQPCQNTSNYLCHQLW